MTPKAKSSRYMARENKENILPCIPHRHGVGSPSTQRRKMKGVQSNNTQHLVTKNTNRNGQRTQLQSIGNTVRSVPVKEKPIRPRQHKHTSITKKQLPGEPKRFSHAMVTRSRTKACKVTMVTPSIPVIYESGSESSSSCDSTNITHLTTSQEGLPDAVNPRLQPKTSDADSGLESILDSSSADSSTDGIDLRELLEELPDLYFSPPKPVVDIDAKGDIMTMKDYAKDFYAYLQSIEHKTLCPSNYLQDVHPGMPTSSMRSVLLDWLMQVQSHLNLKDETLHLTAKLIDKFQLMYPVKLDRFQLIGVSCLLLAAKYEERFAPEVDLLVHLTDNSYTRQEVLDMEQIVWRTLNYDLCWPTSMTFLRRYLQVIAANEELTCSFTQLKILSLYLVDLALIFNSMTSFYPSEIAAASLCLALYILNPELPDVWDATMIHYSNYTERQLNACIGRLAELVSQASCSKFQAPTKKYSKPRDCVQLIATLSQTPAIQECINTETAF